MSEDGTLLPVLENFGRAIVTGLDWIAEVPQEAKQREQKE